MGFLFHLVTRFTNGRNLDTSDEALDGAADFQQGFREYLPLYNEYTGAALSLETDIQRPYDELREIDFARLSEVAEQGAAIADGVQETREEINTKVGEVTGWTGDASNAFLAHIQRFQTAAQTVDGELGAIASATGEAVPAGQAVIAEYVATIRDIDFSGFDPPELIRILITIEGMAMSVSELVDRLYDGIGDLIGMALPVFSSGGGGLFGSIPGVSQVVDAVSGFAGDLLGGVLDFFGGADDLLALASRLARAYLDASFKQPFENNLELLHGAVAAATQGITEAFQPMVEAAGAVTPSGFTALGDAPEDDPAEQQPPGGGQPPGSTQPVSDPGGPPAGGGPPPGGGGGSGGGPVGPVTPPGGGGGPVEPATPPGTGGLPVQPPGGGGSGPTPPIGDGPPTPPAGDGGPPDDLPPGAGWVADPSQLPDGWTVDPETGELLPPGAPGGEGDPEVHSPEGEAVLDGNGPGDVSILPVPGGVPETPSEITMQIGDLTLTISGADGGTGDGLGLTLTDADGDSTRYEIRVDENGVPQLVPVEDSGLGEPQLRSAGSGPGDLPTVAAAPVHAVPGGVAAPFPTVEPAGVANGVSAPGGEPGTGQPGTGQPGAGHPGAGHPGAGHPGAGQPPAAGHTPGAGVPPAASAGGSAVQPGAHGFAPPPGAPAATTPAAEGFGGGTVQPGVSPAGGHVVSGGPSVSGGEVSTSGPGYAAASDGGQVAGGTVSFGGHATSADGAAQLASASMASDSGTTGSPGGAQLASAADDGRTAQGGGAPFAPMGAGAGGGGDEERRGGTWQLPGSTAFEADDEATRVEGVIGEDR